MSDMEELQFDELKDTITELNIMIKAQTTMIESLQKSIDDLRQQLEVKDQETAKLEAQKKALMDKLNGA